MVSEKKEPKKVKEPADLEKAITTIEGSKGTITIAVSYGIFSRASEYPISQIFGDRNEMSVWDIIEAPFKTMEKEKVEYSQVWDRICDSLKRNPGEYKVVVKHNDKDVVERSVHTYPEFQNLLENTKIQRPEGSATLEVIVERVDSPGAIGEKYLIYR